MTFGDRLRSLRVDLGLSQDAIGSQGFVSAPGWVKLENNQRQASEKLIGNLVKWLVGDKYIKANISAALREELLVLKYLGSSSPFIRRLAKTRAEALPNGAELTAPDDPAIIKLRHRRSRPPLRKQ